MPDFEVQALGLIDGSYGPINNILQGCSALNPLNIIIFLPSQGNPCWRIQCSESWFTCYCKCLFMKLQSVKKGCPIASDKYLNSSDKRKTEGTFHSVRTCQPGHGQTRQFENEIGFYQYFRIWLIWLESFVWKENYHWDGNGLAGLFWQMESALRLLFHAWNVCYWVYFKLISMHYHTQE